MTDKKNRSDADWRDVLSPDVFRVTREKGTEPPFSGALCGLTRPGTYSCACCGAVLFQSTAKYDSGSGWPSFFEPSGDGVIVEHRDRSHGMVRTEVTCAACNAHLGHVFPDGPPPSGLRYCINSLSLDHEPEE
jgi:peptide-methionine (R)-S-oxide reductase